MKYIRTKDGTIELNREEIEREIIKEADTIEKLCDKWVYDNNIDEVNVIKNIDRFSLYEMEKLVLGKYVFNVKLAIFTNKGLIYVAKMNEKGELELL